MYDNTCLACEDVEKMNGDVPCRAVRFSYLSVYQKHRSLSPTPGASDVVGLGWGLRTGISNR